jgi:hypothetical protein
VFAQYDGVADFPDNPFNLLAVTNAIMGGEQLHVEAANYPILTQSTYYSQTTGSNGGTTTIVMIPTPVLPLLQPMLDAGADPAKVAALDAKLRPKIDRAYKRPQFQQGVIAPGVVDYPPGYTPPPPPATTSATTAAATIPAADVAATSVDASSPASAPVGAPRTTDQAINKLLAENATASTQPLDVPASNVVAAPAVSATTTEPPTADEQNGSENSSVAASSQPATNSSDASANDAGSQNGSTSGTSHVKSRATKAGSSASSGTHSTSRKLGHRN